METAKQSCRHCGGTELYFQEVGASGGYGPNLLPLGIFSNPEFIVQVCGQCGLVEWFVPPRFLSKVREKFKRVPN